MISKFNKNVFIDWRGRPIASFIVFPRTKKGWDATLCRPWYVSLHWDRDDGFSLFIKGLSS